MPSLATYKEILSSYKHDGDVRKSEADMIIEDSWYEDISSRTAYLYDFYHDSEPQKLKAMNSFADPKKTAVEIKFIEHAHQSYASDKVTFHIMFKPSYECNVTYYNEMFKNRYDSIFPVGLYIDIPDEKGIYNRWLVVNTADYYGNQFPTYEVLPCDKILQYIFDGMKCQIACVLRSQNSYNSGLWTDYKVETIEDQYKFIVPLNRDTEKIYYNQRMLIDAMVLSEPRAWKISKINRTSSSGIIVATLAQDRFDQQKDFIEINPDTGNVIGMWADYYVSPVLPEEPEEPILPVYGTINFSGASSTLKSGGSYKTYTAKLSDESVITGGEWSYELNGEDATPLLTIIPVSDAIVKVKFIGGDTYINSVLTIKYVTTSGIAMSLDVAIAGL